MIFQIFSRTLSFLSIACAVSSLSVWPASRACLPRKCVAFLVRESKSKNTAENGCMRTPELVEVTCDPREGVCLRKYLNGNAEQVYASSSAGSQLATIRQ